VRLMSISSNFLLKTCYHVYCVIIVQTVSCDVCFVGFHSRAEEENLVLETADSARVAVSGPAPTSCSRQVNKYSETSSII